MKKGTTKKLCPLGHDTSIVGRSHGGCNECSRLKKEAYKLTIKGRFTQNKFCAKQNGHSWKISIEEYKLLPSFCFVIGCPDSVSGLDRIDCSKGYLIGNVRPACSRHNEMRNDMSDVELYRKAKEIVAWYESLLPGTK